MSNEFTGLITSEFKLMHQNMITELIRGLAVPCTLIYGDSVWTMCDNCSFSAILGRSSGIYLTGGPIAFSTGVCPKCKGVGRLATENTTSVSLVVLWDYKSWIMSIPVHTPEAYVQTICAFSYFDDIKKAKEAIMDTNITDYTRNRFMRDGEPKPCGLGASNFAVTMWKRIE